MSCRPAFAAVLICLAPLLFSCGPAVRPAAVGSLPLLPAQEITQRLRPGLLGAYFAFDHDLTNFPRLAATDKPAFVRIDPRVAFDLASGPFHATKLAEHFYVRWSGVLKAPQTGIYTIYTVSDDGSRLWIDEKLIVDNGGLHSMIKATGEVNLGRGPHTIRIEYFESGGDAGCVVGWRSPGGQQGPIPAEVLFHTEDQANVSWDQEAWENGQWSKVTAAGQEPAKGGQIKPGLVGEYFHIGRDLTTFPVLSRGTKPTLVRIDRQINFAATLGEFHRTKLDEQFYARWNGIIRAPQNGVYTFYTTSDDGSRLWIDGKLVVSNDGLHSMQKQSGQVELVAGNHAIEIEFFENNRDAGLVVGWQPPGGNGKGKGKEETLPAGALFHPVGAEKIAWDRKAWTKRKGGKSLASSPKPPPRWSFMDLGPTFSSTIQVGSTNVPKAIAIRVGAKGEAAVCYDEDLLRMVGGWTGGFVTIHPGRDALLGNDGIEGNLHFSTPELPGWAEPGDYSDPRTGSQLKAGPLPRGWARYKGLYMHGDKVVLSYTLGSGSVLEHPWAEQIGGHTVFTRTFEISGLRRRHHVLLAGTGSGKVTVKGSLAWSKSRERGSKETVLVVLTGDTSVVRLGKGPQGTIVAEVRPARAGAGTGAARFKVWIWKGPAKDPDRLQSRITSASQPIDLQSLTQGGPRRWTEVVTTRGRLGTGDGAYVLDTITPPFDNPYRSIMHFGGHDFFSNGDAAISTMEGDVWLVKGIDKNLERITWQRIATGLYHPLGVKIVNDELYVLCRDQIARLHDLNGDGEIDFYECFNNDCHVGLNTHEFATGLETDPQGNFYYIKGTNKGQTMHDSSVIRVSADGSKLERFATGFRWPNGMGMSPSGVLTVADQQGTWVPSSKIDWIEPGGFYGFMLSTHQDVPPTASDRPLCWIPHSVDNSCGGQVWVEGERWGPLEGMMLHLSYGKCRLFLTLHEKIGDVRQGGVVTFPIPKFDSGSMRARFRQNDGQLYVSGLKGWQTSGARDGCFQRVRYTGKPVRLPTQINVSKSGIFITFTTPLDPDTAADADNYAIEQWNYRWTKKYGSPEFSVADPNKKGHDKVAVKSAKISPDRKTVFLEVPGIQPVMQMQIRYRIDAADGTMLNQTIYNTIHVLGPDRDLAGFTTRASSPAVSGAAP